MKFLWDLLEEELGKNYAAKPALKNNVLRLSQYYTIERGALNYFDDPHLTSAYLAYFLPLNFYKVLWVLQSNQSLWKKPNIHGEQHWLDYGCGLGTASLAALAAYAQQPLHPTAQEATVRQSLYSQPIHIDLVDTQPAMLPIAQRLITKFAQKLGLKVYITTYPDLQKLNQNQKYTLTLAVNVLNELQPKQSSSSNTKNQAIYKNSLNPDSLGKENQDAIAHHVEPHLQLWSLTKSCFLLIEPAHRVSSDRLIRFRERLLKDATTRDTPIHILAPCTHQKRCPVYRSRYWCHFSEPVFDQKLIQLNLNFFNNPRLWLKFSYLLACREEEPMRPSRTFRAIGDLHPSGPKHFAIDLCQPNTKLVWKVPRQISQSLKNQLTRGKLVRL